MAARIHPNLVEMDISREVKNGLRMAGFDLNNVTADRPLPPDGLKILAELWSHGATVPEIMDELRLSEARATSELLFLELKGRITGLVAAVCGR